MFTPYTAWHKRGKGVGRNQWLADVIASFITRVPAGGVVGIGAGSLPHQSNLRRGEVASLVDEVAEGALQGLGFGVGEDTGGCLWLGI